MKRSFLAANLAAMIAILTLAVLMFVLMRSSSSPHATAAVNPAPGAPLTAGDDSNPTGPLDVRIPADYQPRPGSAPNIVPTSTVYFTPQDENTSTTVLFLYNTNPITETVGIQTYYINGSLTLNTSVAVPPNGMARICADTVTTISASWSKYVLINFTTFSAYAKMSLPAGVKADGYIAWDISGVYDPLASLQTAPLRFSADPATVFLPSAFR
jgi:hypothetical protein